MLMSAKIRFYRRSLAFIMIISMVIMSPVRHVNAKYQLPRKFIHACGSYEGQAYTNSVEALDNTLKHSVKAIEVDLNYTSDGYLIGAHYCSGRLAYLQNVYDFTVLTADVLLKKLNENEGIYLIVDSKCANINRVYRDLVKICTDNGYDSMLDRIVPQLYSEEDYKTISSVYDFKEYIFTLYRITGKNSYVYKDIAKFCKKNGIKTVTISKGCVKKSVCNIFKKQGIKVYTHTVNSKKQYKKYKKMGVYGVYTDKVSL